MRLPSVTLGDITVPGVVANLDAPNSGSMSDPNYQGNIGSGFLKRFVLTLDYAHQTLYLKPIVPPPGDIGTFDRSGMWINASPNGFRSDLCVEGRSGRAGRSRQGRRHHGYRRKGRRAGPISPMSVACCEAIRPAAASRSTFCAEQPRGRS